MSQSRHLAAIMFTDIVGYTALMGKDSHKALELVRHSKEIQKPLVEKHNGKWLKEMGDGALAQFNTALDSINCALEIQRTSRADFAGDLRIGIHLGDITLENDDVFGDGVNVAARLESIADPGGIYISESIEKAIQGQTDVQTQYLGEVQLKNVAYKVRTYSVQGVGLPIPQIKEDKELSGHLWAEVQRRGMVRAAISYLVIALLLILIWDKLPSWGLILPHWWFQALLTVLGIGFPIALLLAWYFERSPKGFVKTTSKESWQNPFRAEKRKPLTGKYSVVVLTLVIIILYFLPNQKGLIVDSKKAIDKSIAVIPFDDISPKGDQKWFSEGVTSAILKNLTLIKDLKVKSKTSVIPYRGSNKTVPQIASELGVSYILEGEIQLVDDSVRITAQLIDAISDTHIWSENYDRPFNGIFSLQSSIAKNVAEVLEAEINPEVTSKIDKHPTNSAEAYALYLRAVHYEDAEEIFSLLDQAIAIDSSYADAYALKGLTWLWYLGGLWGSGNNSVQTVISNSSRLLLEALELDPHNALAHFALGAIQLWYFWNFEEAEREWSKAKDLDPETPYLYGNYCELLIATGRFYEALNLAQEAFDKELISEPLLIPFIFAGRKEVADSLLDTQLDMSTHLQDLHPETVAIQALFYLERFEEAIRFSERITSDGTSLKDVNSRLLAVMAMSYHSVGEPNKMNEIIKILEDRSNASLVGVSPAYHLALIYSHKGDTEKAFEWLENAYRTHEIEMYHLKTDPPFESLHEDPRWNEMLEKVGVPNY